MLVINNSDVQKYLKYPDLIKNIRNYFESGVEVPPRSHHHYSTGTNNDSTLLMMPVFGEKYVGVKLAFVSPENKQLGIPAIHASYTLSDRLTGQTLAVMDARSLTARRTAATSALASSYLSRENSKKLLVIGTGPLAHEMLHAHASVRNLNSIQVWGRDFQKAEKLVEESGIKNVEIKAVKNLGIAVAEADIISAATSSREPLIEAKHIKPGQHIDLVGSFSEEMREIDDEGIASCSVFLETEQAMYESGDLIIPLKNKSLSTTQIQGTLTDLVRGKIEGRKTDKEITCYKSVGYSLEDLAAAVLVYESTIEFSGIFN